MKYIKTNESFREELKQAENMVHEKYSKIIDDCLLALSDISFENEDSIWDDNGCCRSYFTINTKDNTYEELSNTLKDSVDKLEFNKMNCFIKLKYNGGAYSENLSLVNALERLRINSRVVAVSWVKIMVLIYE